MRYVIIGNTIDFNPLKQNPNIIWRYFRDIDRQKLTIDDSERLHQSLKQAKVLLYLGDNCLEICLDRLLIENIRSYCPELTIYFATRGAAVINDVTVQDAYQVGMDQYAQIISNGDDSLGTILSRTSTEFLKCYQHADMIIAKGQANYESLSEQMDSRIYFLLMAKC